MFRRCIWADAGLFDGVDIRLPVAGQVADGIGTQLGDDEATLLAPGYGDDDADEDTEVAGDAETLLAPMDDDEEDFERYVLDERGVCYYGYEADMVEMARAELEDLTGMQYNPLSKAYRLGGSIDVNYLAHASRPAE